MNELQLVFATELGDRMTITVPNPKEVEEGEVVEAMQRIIDAQVFRLKEGFIAEPLEAKLVSRETKIVFQR